jgi:hypothetical protein
MRRQAVDFAQSESSRARHLAYEEALAAWLECECSDDPHAECDHRKAVREKRTVTWPKAA